MTWTFPKTTAHVALDPHKDIDMFSITRRYDYESLMHYPSMFPWSLRVVPASDSAEHVEAAKRMTTRIGIGSVGGPFGLSQLDVEYVTAVYSSQDYKEARQKVEELNTKAVNGQHLAVENTVAHHHTYQSWYALDDVWGQYVGSGSLLSLLQGAGMLRRCHFEELFRHVWRCLQNNASGSRGASMTNDDPMKAYLESRFKAVPAATVCDMACTLQQQGLQKPEDLAAFATLDFEDVTQHLPIGLRNSLVEERRIIKQQKN
mmetsp:Transcript_42830/g.108123  ORF Transcript_42830/g.108123 Transcript_42830/m.108123 type:complete len:260 (-) Transcript_42830:72-851(-)